MVVGFKDRGKNLDKINDKEPLYPPRIFLTLLRSRSSSQNLLRYL